jgi:replicative DNA helicase
MSNVTIFPNVKQTDNPHYITVGQALERIRTGGKHLPTLELVRQGNREIKKDLPIVLWSGEFSDRKDTSITNHSGLIVLDFDHIDVEGSKTVLSTDDYVFACWISPSGEGLKALVKITNPESHRDHFRALQAYFDKQYGLEVDSSGINESRACFDSYDPQIVINSSSRSFGQLMSEKAMTQQTAIQGEGYTDYNKLAVVSSMIRKAEDGEKHAMLLKAAVLCGGFISAGRMEEDEAIRILEREIVRRNVDSIESARTTIRDGIEKGKTMPIREVIDGENKAKLEMMINDGDMSFISSDDEDFRWIQDFANGNISIGLNTGDEELDKYFRYKPELVIMNGHSNVGKTTMALYMIVNSAVRHNWKWIIYSAENKTASIKMKLMQFATGLPINDMRNDEIKMAYKWVNEHFKIISNNQNYSYTDLMIFGEKLIRQQEYQGYFIDPYNALKIQMSSGNGLSTHEYHYEAASELLTFSNKNKMAVWLNTHSVTESQRIKGPDGLPMAPYAESTEGGGKFVNRSDCFLTFHRKVQHPDYDMRRTMEFHVRKVRETETGGEPTPIDSPILFEMNRENTGFIGKSSRISLFNTIVSEKYSQRLFKDKVEPDINFRIDDVF